MSLYDEALTHFLGGEEQVILPVPVIGNKGHLHDQKMRLLAPGVAFRLTAFTERLMHLKLMPFACFNTPISKPFSGPTLRIAMSPSPPFDAVNDGKCSAKYGEAVGFHI